MKDEGGAMSQAGRRVFSMPAARANREPRFKKNLGHPLVCVMYRRDKSGDLPGKNWATL